MKSIYDKKDLQTDESQKSAIKIEKAVKPILEEYLKKGFSIRDLSHEAQSVVRDCELDHVVLIHIEDAKRAKESLKRKKLDNKTANKFGLTEKDWDYGTDGKPI